MSKPEEMLPFRSLRLWNVTVGRATQSTIAVGAETLDKAVDVAVDYCKDWQRSWKDVDRDDIRAIKEMDFNVILKAEPPQ